LSAQNPWFPSKIALAKAAFIGLVLGVTWGDAPSVAAESKNTPIPQQTPVRDPKFDAFLQDFRAEALKAGITASLYDQALSGINPIARVQELNQTQPEFVRPVWEYLDNAVSARRIADGQAALAANAALFDQLETRYGVPRTILAAIWGVESSYGTQLGSFNIFGALATLAYDGPRQPYGRTQLLAALKLAQDEHIDPSTMNASWAGGIGHTQFIPTTYLAHAVDGDGDGKRDLWHSPADALASTASYLSASGWKAGEDWGQEVRLPENFAYEDAEIDIEKPIADWVKQGLTDSTGAPLAGGTQKAALFLPAGAKGPAFLLRGNFFALLKYNTTTSYALAVSLLSDRLQGKASIATSWPREEMPLNSEQRLALQLALEALGFGTGGVDGVLGKNTRTALRAYQKARGLSPDGFATVDMLSRVTAEWAKQQGVD
jgi:membrane-bound lytic murein transglycosylase B